VQGFLVAAGQEAIVNGNLQIIRMELKYCEACGALRLRAQGSSAPYCSRCAAVLAEVARATRPVPAGRKRA